MVGAATSRPWPRPWRISWPGSALARGISIWWLSISAPGSSPGSGSGWQRPRDWRGIGVIGLSSLEILTRAAVQLGHGGHLLAAVDARRGEVFASVCESRPGQARTEDVIGSGLFSPEGLAEALAGLGGVPIMAIGDGAQRYAEVLRAVPGVACVLDGLSSPPPLTLLDMAVDLYAAGVAPVAPELVVPLYMREADATSNFVQVTTN